MLQYKICIACHIIIVECNSNIARIGTDLS
jgi:hypothetical protein